MTHPDEDIYPDGSEWNLEFKKAKVHIQWDPERTIKGSKLNQRTIQVGISKELIEEFNNTWIEEISDLTTLTKKINGLRKTGNYEQAKKLLPKEKVYKVSDVLGKRIGIKK